MATKNSIDSNIPIGISKGGTNSSSMANTNGIAYFDGSSIKTTAVGASTQVLTSNGTGAAPTFEDAASSALTVNNQTASYTLVLTDNGKLVSMSSASPTIVTIPLNSSVAFDIGSEILVYRDNATVSIKPTSGVTLEYDSSTGARDIEDKYMSVRLIKTATDTWVMKGAVLDFPELTWTDNSSSPTSDHIYALTYGKGTWVIADTSGGNVYVTQDPTSSWVEVSTAYTSSWDDAESNDDYFALIGGTDLYTATDPYGAWTQLPSNPFGSVAIRALEYSSALDMWFIGGDQFKIYSCGSDPSGTWTSRASGVSTSQGIRKMASSPTHVVAVGSNGYTSVSIDGTTWIAYSGFDSIDMRGVAYGDGLWLYGGESGSLYIGTDPTDPTTFIKSQFAANEYIDSIEYKDSLWIIGTDGYIYYTYDPYGVWYEFSPTVTTAYYEHVIAGGYIVSVGGLGSIITASRLARDVVGYAGIHVTDSTNLAKITNDITINTQTGTAYTVTLSDAGSMITMNNASASTLTIPTNSSAAFPVGTTMYIQQLGAGVVTLTPAAGVTFRSIDNVYNLTKQYEIYSIVKIASDTWSINGSISSELANKFTSDSGDGVPSSGVLTVSGGTNIATSATGSTLTVAFDGTLPVANGGTGATTLTSHGIITGNGTSAVSATAEPTNGQFLIGSTGNAPTLATLTAGAGISVTNAAGSVTVDSLLSINAQTGTSYTVVLGDAGKMITMNNAAASTLTIPLNSSVAFPVGTTIYVQQLGAGQVTLTPTAGVTFRSADDAYKTNKQYSGCSLTKILSDTWSIFGDVSV